MAIVIKIKKSETADDAPTTSDLAVGEVALNTADKKIYVRDSSNSIINVSNYSEGDVSLIYPTGDYGSVANALSEDAFGQLIDKIYDLKGDYTSVNPTIKMRVATEDLGAFS